MPSRQKEIYKHMLKKLRHIAKPGIVLVLSMLLGASLFATPVLAVAKYKFTDVKTAYNMTTDYEYKFTGDYIASIEKDKNGAMQVLIHNWKKKTTEAITNTNTFKTNMAVHGDNLFYYESTIEVTKNISTYKKTLKQYNMKTKKTTDTILETNYPMGLFVGDKYLAYSESGGNYYILNRETKKNQEIIRLGHSPKFSFANDKYVYENNSTLYFHDIASAKTVEISKTKNNDELRLLNYNGRDIVWMVDSKEMDTVTGKYIYYNTYMTMDRWDSSAKARVLYKRIQTGGNNERNNLLIIGDNYVVFSDFLNNKLIARAINLRNNESFVIGERNSTHRIDNYIYFNKDILIMRDAKDFLTLRTFVRTP